ncbi:MAG: hypothetical protein AAFO04_28245 [Cyanobacteria bacterium J06592_8]
MPRKKLSTKPIRIDVPEVSSQSTSGIQDPDQKQDSVKQDSSLQESNILEARRQESSLQESSKTETVKPDSSLQDSSKPDSSLKPESNQPETTKQDFSFPESSQPESSLTETEYKKVAMRLSLQAADHLRQFRSDTGIPYEILVDVMVRNWSKLPERTRSAYLKQAQQLRSQRLLAGQEKTMKTLQQKYQQHL